jgi:hypothetical protein
MPQRIIVVATHGHCFDGLVSAVLFTDLRRRLEPPPTAFEYRSCGYGPKLKTVPERWLKGDENAIIDFRFSPSERLTWYFDHHPTAFGSPEEQAAALARDKVFYDPSHDSCAGLIHQVATEHFGVELGRSAELVAAANQIDGARFESAEEALDRSTPVMRLASVIEQHGDGPLLSHLVAELLERSVDEVVASEKIQTLWKPLALAHEQTRQRIGEAARMIDEVVYVDLAEAPLAASGKFYAYAFQPASRYSVALLRMKQHLKVSVGFNPWSPTPRRHDVAGLCQQHGGGGHADVGAVTFPLADIDRARQVARSLVDELNR